MNAVVERDPTRIYQENDPDLPDELRNLIVNVLTKHVENSTNPHFSNLLNHLWERCMTLCPDEETKDQLALLMMKLSQ